MNAHIRDNFLETSAATALALGDIIFADAANSMGNRLGIASAGAHLVSTTTGPIWRGITTDGDSGTNTTTSTTYVTLSSMGFAGEIETNLTTAGNAFIFFKAILSNDTAGSGTYLSYSVSGAATSVASNARAIHYESSGANDEAEFGGFDLRTGLTGGNHDFTLEARVTSGTGTIARPEIAVIAL